MGNQKGRMETPTAEVTALQREVQALRQQVKILEESPHSNAANSPFKERPASKCATAIRTTAAAHTTTQMKILVMGDAKCGKTSLIQRFANDVFAEEYKKTIGADFCKKTVDLDSNNTVRLQLWDIAGQDRFADVTRAYFRNVAGAIVVCDTTRPLTSHSALKWKQVLDEKVKGPNGESIPVILMANKTDLLKSAAEAFEVGANVEKVCSEEGFASWFVVSAKANKNVKEGVGSLLWHVLDSLKQKEVTSPGMQKAFGKAAEIFAEGSGAFQLPTSFDDQGAACSSKKNGCC